MITIKLFGITREIVGESTLTIKQDVKTVAGLLVFLKKTYPRLNELASLLVAVDSTYASSGTKLRKGQEVAIIPPVSGG